MANLVSNEAELFTNKNGIILKLIWSLINSQFQNRVLSDFRSNQRTSSMGIKADFRLQIIQSSHQYRTDYIQYQGIPMVTLSSENINKY